MDKDFKRLTDFLLGIGIEQVPHTHKSYLARLIAVYRDAGIAPGCPEDVCRAGMFHSIYGTEKFQGFTLAAFHARGGGSRLDRRKGRAPGLLELCDGPRIVEQGARSPGQSRIGKKTALSGDGTRNSRGPTSTTFAGCTCYDWLEQVPR